MSVESELYTWLSSDAAITAVVGTRIFPQRVPQGKDFPAITFQVIFGDHVHDLKASAGLGRPIFQVNAISPSYLEAKDLAELIRLRLQGFRGVWGTLDVRAVLLNNLADLPFEVPKDESDQGYYTVAGDYRVVHAEPIPTF